ncbi:MAG: hypothetical protein A2Y76_01665 [Planctomycetes bacterium RBG_13_60_9]|nr:MAG: hypothetical protein A2Y76_01665 [Planctomycetes bacterium RBG_13_60_9]
MAITTTAVSITSAKWSQTSAIPPWQVNASSADASGCEEIVATPGAGYQLVLCRAYIYVGAAITVSLGQNDNAGTLETTLIGPLAGAAGNYILDVRDQPIILAANKALCVDASGAGQVCIYVEGYTRAA